MSTVTVKRPPRSGAPDMPSGDVQLEEPPVMDEPAKADMRSFLGFLPMALMSGSMMLIMTSVFSASRTTMLVMGGVIVVAMGGMGLVQLGRNAGERKKRMASERRDYLRYLAQLRTQARETATRQRHAVQWNNPDPSWLWSVAMGTRLWERRASHDDFGRARIGIGKLQASRKYAVSATKPVEDLEPLCTISLRRFTETYNTIPGIPISVGLRNFTSVELSGDLVACTGLVRAILAQLVTFHAPDELRVAVLAGEGARQEWDWVKWLPHNAHPKAFDHSGAARLLACDHDELMDLLGSDITDRGDHDSTSRPSAGEPYVVIVADRTRIPAGSRLTDSGLRNVVLLDLTGDLPGGEKVLRMTLDGATVEYPAGGSTATARTDTLGPGQMESLARVLAPKRTSGILEIVDTPLESDFELTTLLGITDAHTFDVSSQWRTTAGLRARMQVPIGVTENGEVVELDLKEPAQGGMGPHGMLIGATGSGKSELLRTLVCGLVATHSSEILNLVLVDFKGGATFLGMEQLPHTSAVITNLADELPLVDRMQDALNGEMNRRQEALRASGYSSLYEYEKARASGASLAPFPVLLVIVDEFSELLSSKSDFMDLFVSIGRLGRSLGVHLLLASQRLDEGRISRVEGHLSYRIALRTFSSMESRSVIGVGKAHELPSAPGNGYLKIDTVNLVRFKGAYVSGPYARQGAGELALPEPAGHSDVVPFSTLPHPGESLLEGSVGQPELSGAELEDDTEAPYESEHPILAEVLLGRLRGAGPPARQVWLPPLAESPSLDSLVPSVVPHPYRGMTLDDAGMRGVLRSAVGVVDRPYEQRRELLVANLGGANGHVGIAGAPQSGKSTLVRTLVLGLALANTPAEVQFYCLDFGGGGVMSVGGLPHVGSVATRLERDRVVRTIAELVQVMEHREAAFSEHGFESLTSYFAARDSGTFVDRRGHVFLIVDGWATVRQEFEDVADAIGDLASRGLSFGIHVVITATRWSEIRPWVRDLLGTKFELRLGDYMESEVSGRKAATVPSQPGRGMTSGGYHFLVALPRLDGNSTVEDLGDVTKATAEEFSVFWPGAVAPVVRMLPNKLPVGELPGPEDKFRVCLGHDEQRLEPMWHDFFRTPHLMVFGDAETGKTNLLRLVVRAVQRHYTSAEAKIVVADSRRELDKDVAGEYQVGYGVTTEDLEDLSAKAAVSVGKRVPGQEITSDRLPARDWWEGAELFVVVDDYELLCDSQTGTSTLDLLMPLIAQGVHIGLHVIVARSTSSAMRAMMDPVLRRLWELGTPGLLLSYPKEEGGFLGEAKPRNLPPGRAQLVTRRGIQLVQTGLVTDDERIGVTAAGRGRR